MKCNLFGRRMGSAVLISTFLAFSPPAGADEGEALRKVLADRAPTVVTVKFVLKIKMGDMGEHEGENEINGVMIGADGLVLCSNTQLGGFTAIMKQMMGSMGEELTAFPTNLRVLLDNDPEEHAAELIARDSELDLAWIRIKDPGEKKFPFVDLAKSGKAKVGDRVCLVQRMGKYFGRTAVAHSGSIVGHTKKPRDLMVLSGNLESAMGLPAYLMNGELLGVMIIQMPDDADDSDNPMAIFSQMMNLSEAVGGFILSASEVASATRRALESVAPVEEEN